MTFEVPKRDYQHLEAEVTVWKPSGLAVCIALAAAIATMASIALPWISAGVGGDSIDYSGLQLPPAGIPVLIAALATAVLAVASIRSSSALAPLAVVVSGIGAAIAAAVILLAEVATFVMPFSLLPSAIGNSTLAVGAGYGIWLALIGSATAAIAMHGRLSSSIGRRARFSREEWRRAPAFLGLVTLTALIAWLRYQTWIDASLVERHLPLPAWAAPWIGPFSLISVLMLVCAMGLVAFSSTRLAGLVAAVAGWLISLLAALAVLAVGSFGRLGIEGSSAGGSALGFHTTAFVWIAFLAGLTAASVGAFLVHSPIDRRA